MPQCPNCGEDNPARARFCLACGDTLARPAPPQDVRKTVTIVFSDLVGSTSLGERLDSESLREVLARYFDAMQVVLERHGGVVEKFIGDAVMAVFGLARMHEDDALRAVRAAAEMGTARDALNAELEATFGVTLQNRTGVNTGQVVAGDPAVGQRLVTGDTVNTAARLEQAASPGQVLLGDSTLRLVKDAVTTEPVPPLSLKGKSEPVPAHRLVSVTSDTEVTTRRLDAPLVGRRTELALLNDAFDRAVTRRKCERALVLGEAGVGKSRLVAELTAAIGGRAKVISGRCLSYGEGITYWPVTEVVRTAAAIAPDDSAEAARGKVGSLLTGVEERDAVAEPVCALMGLSTATVAVQDSFWGIRKLFEAIALRCPLAIVFEDVHWGEPTFLDLIEHLVELTQDAPLLLMCSARPELFEARPEWESDPSTTLVRLRPLSKDDGARLITDLLDTTTPADDVASRVFEVAGGNPLFVEQIVSMWIEDGVLVRTDDHWVISPNARVSAPPTIAALLSARLDRLMPQERTVVGAASVIGMEFYLEAVENLCPHLSASEVTAHISGLTGKELVRANGSDLTGWRSYWFRHALIREAAYEALLKRTRAELHERFGAWLEGATSERVGEYEEILGFHLEQAYRLRVQLGRVDEGATAIAHRAAQRLGAAGRRANGRGDIPGAINLLSRATDLLPAQDEERIDLLAILADALAAAGEFDRSQAVLNEAVEGVVDSGNRVLQCRIELSRLKLASMAESEGWAERASDELSHILETFEVFGDSAGLARAWLLSCDVHFIRGSAAGAQHAAELAIEHARKAGDSNAEDWGLGWLAVTMSQGPTPAEHAVATCENILTATLSRVALGGILQALAMLNAYRGRFDEAREYAARTTKVFDDWGHKVFAASNAQITGDIEKLAGDLGSAERGLRSGYEALDGMGEKAYLSTVAGQLADVLCAQSNYEEAERFAAICQEAADDSDFLSQVLWRRARSRIIGHQQQLVEAERLARDGVEIADSTDFINVRADARMDLADVLLLAGKKDEAIAVFRSAQELYEQKGNIVSSRGVTRLLEELERG